MADYTFGVLNKLHAPKPPPYRGGGLARAKQIGINDTGARLEELYRLNTSNWYKAKPYGFKHTARDGNSSVMFLPISPSSLTISTSFATNVIPTLYGTVEEHSNVRYFDISIEGTTGFAPKYAVPSHGLTEYVPQSMGRSSFPIVKGVPIGGFFSKTVGTFTKAANKAMSLLDGTPQTESGFMPALSGYAAFHNLYRFLLLYKKDAAGEGTFDATKAREEHPLVFFNYKDNNQYNVVIRNFSLRRSADNPMLYYYSIRMQGYNLKTAGAPKRSKSTTGVRLKTAGLKGINGSSVRGNMVSATNQTKSIIGSAMAGIKGFGQ